MKTCARCGTELKLTRRLIGRRVCAPCEQLVDDERRREAALLAQRREGQQDAYRKALQPLYDGPVPTLEALEALHALRPGSDLSPEDIARVQSEALFELARNITRDGRISWWEGAILTNVATILGALTPTGWAPPFADLAVTCTVGIANDGRLSAQPMPKEVPAKRDEVLHATLPAVRLDEVRTRELVLSQNALSFEFRDGLAYQRGRLTGTEREVSQGIQATDSGSLLVTSQRIVFVGQLASEEIALSRLIGVQMYGDAVQFRVAGKRRSPSFRFNADWSQAVVATVNTATQIANGSMVQDGESEVPPMPEASPECEALLQRGAAVGWPEQSIRGWRLLFHLGELDRAKLEGKIAALEASAGPPHPGPHAVHQPPPVKAPDGDLELKEPSRKPIGSAKGADYEIEVDDLALIEPVALPDDLHVLGQLAVLRLRVKNTGKAPVDFYGRNVVLKDHEDTTYEAWTGGAEDSFRLSDDFGDLFLSERLQPKLWAAGAVVYDLPVDVKLASVELPASISATGGAAVRVLLAEGAPRRVGTPDEP